MTFFLYILMSYVVMFGLMCFRNRNGIAKVCVIEQYGNDCWQIKDGDYVRDSLGQTVRKIDVINTNRALGVFFLLSPATTPITLICLLFSNILGLSVKIIESATPNIFQTKSNRIEELERQLAELKAKMNNSVEITDGL